MKTWFVILSISLLLTIKCKSGQDTITLNHTINPTANPDSITSYRIFITNYYFGRAQFITRVTEDSIETIHDNLNGKTTADRRVLTSDESSQMKSFLATFPLNKLKESYINENVEDGINIGFDISINIAHKRIYVSNYYQDDLGKLVNEIRLLLKEDYIGYRKENFR
jgi:hypothetical protein